MNASEKDRVIKVLNLTRSENDNEALIAVRQANKLVSDWTEFFGGQAVRAKMTKQYGGSGMPKEAPTKTSWSPDIQEMLDDLEREDHSFINSLAQQYSDRGYLTPKQTRALETFWRRLD